jgi:hypothetical protein
MNVLCYPPLPALPLRAPGALRIEPRSPTLPATHYAVLAALPSREPGVLRNGSGSPTLPAARRGRPRTRMVRMIMVVMISGDVPVTAVAGNLPPSGAILKRSPPTIATTASLPTPDTGKTRKVAPPNEPGNGRIGKSATHRRLPSVPGTMQTTEESASPPLPPGSRNEANDGGIGKTTTMRKTVRVPSQAAPAERRRTMKRVSWRARLPDW